MVILTHPNVHGDLIRERFTFSLCLEMNAESTDVAEFGYIMTDVDCNYINAAPFEYLQPAKMGVIANLGKIRHRTLSNVIAIYLSEKIISISAVVMFRYLMVILSEL